MMSVKTLIGIYDLFCVLFFFMRRHALLNFRLLGAFLIVQNSAVGRNIEQRL